MIVYRHLRRDTNEPFYIGISKDVARAKSRKNRNKYWYHIVDKVGYEIEIILENLTEKEACEKEIEFIALYKRTTEGGTLVNRSIGGEYRGIGVTDEWRKDKSKYYSGPLNPMYGRKRDDIAIYMEKYREKNSLAMKKFNKETKSKPVLAHKIYGGQKTIFSSQREASRALRIDQSRIWLVMNGRAKTSGGYKFSYI